MNQDLKAAYQQFMPAFQAALETANVDYAKLSAPLLLKVFPEYTLATNKLFVVGQETNWWGEEQLGGKEYAQHSADTIALLMQCYEQFGMGQAYKKTPIVSFMSTLYRLLNPEMKTNTGFLWSNLYKTDQRGKRPPEAVRTALRTCQPTHILAQEIRIAQPDTVVFATGWSLDWEIEKIFPGAAFEPLSGPFLAQVRHPDLPEDATFRTYHPSYLNWRKRLKPIAEQIAELVQNKKSV